MLVCLCFYPSFSLESELKKPENLPVGLKTIAVLRKSEKAKFRAVARFLALITALVKIIKSPVAEG